MAIRPTPATGLSFSSPTMVARAQLVRGLDLVDQAESAWHRRDWAAVQTTVDQLRVIMAQVERAADVMAPPPPFDPADQPETEAEARAAWGDR